MDDFIEGFMLSLCILSLFLFGVLFGRYAFSNVPENEKSISYYKQYVVIDKKIQYCNCG